MAAAVPVILHVLGSAAAWAGSHAALTGALVGGGSSALRGGKIGDILKGAALGGLGGWAGGGLGHALGGALGGGAGGAAGGGAAGGIASALPDVINIIGHATPVAQALGGIGGGLAGGAIAGAPSGAAAPDITITGHATPFAKAAGAGIGSAASGVTSNFADDAGMRHDMANGTGNNSDFGRSLLDRALNSLGGQSASPSFGTPSAPHANIGGATPFGGGGAGAGSPAGLSIRGSTAPDIFPWTQLAA